MIKHIQYDSSKIFLLILLWFFKSFTLKVSFSWNHEAVGVRSKTRWPWKRHWNSNSVNVPPEPFLYLTSAKGGGRGGGGGGGAPLISETSRLTWDKALFSFPKRECMRTVKNWAWSQVTFWQTRLNWLDRLVFIIIVIPTTSANYLRCYLLLRTRELVNMFQKNVFPFNLDYGWVRWQTAFEMPLARAGFQFVFIYFKGPKPTVDILLDDLYLEEILQPSDWKRNSDILINKYRKRNIQFRFGMSLVLWKWTQFCRFLLSCFISL